MKARTKDEITQHENNLFMEAERTQDYNKMRDLAEMLLNQSQTLRDQVDALTRFCESQFPRSYLARYFPG